VHKDIYAGESPTFARDYWGDKKYNNWWHSGRDRDFSLIINHLKTI